MYELTHKDGFKVIAQLKGSQWYDLQGRPLKSDCWTWCKEL